MLAAAHRLRSSKSIESVVKRGQKASTVFVRVYYNAHDDNRTTQIACIAGKKVSKSAVTRHQYQRWLREIAQDFITHYPSNFTIALVANPAITQAKSLEEIRETLWPTLVTIAT